MIGFAYHAADLDRDMSAYRIQAVFDEDASDANWVVYYVLAGTGATLRIEPALDAARRWLYQLIDSNMRRGGHRRRDGTPHSRR